MGARGYDTLPPLHATGLAFWTQGFGSWGQFDGNGNAATADRSLGGFLSGVDAGLGGGWRAGLATGYTQTSVSVNQRLSSAHINSYNLVGYAGGGLGGVALRAAGAWTWHGIDSSRTVLFPGFSENESASYNGDTGQTFGEAALPLGTGATALEPFAGLAYVHVSTGGFTESGAVAGLNSGGNSDDLGYFTLGGRAAMQLRYEGTQVTPHAAVAGSTPSAIRRRAQRSRSTPTGRFRDHGRANRARHRAHRGGARCSGCAASRCQPLLSGPARRRLPGQRHSRQRRLALLRQGRVEVGLGSDRLFAARQKAPDCRQQPTFRDSGWFRGETWPPPRPPPYCPAPLPHGTHQLSGRSGAGAVTRLRQASVPSRASGARLS